jgi:transposase
MDRESLRLLLAQGVSVEEIGRRFGKHPSTVSHWMAKYGFEAPNRDKHAAKGGIQRERLEELVDMGMTIAEISGHVGVSKTTVRYWLKRYDLRRRTGSVPGIASGDATRRTRDWRRQP